MENRGARALTSSTRSRFCLRGVKNVPFPTGLKINATLEPLVILLEQTVSILMGLQEEVCPRCGSLDTFYRYTSHDESPCLTQAADRLSLENRVILLNSRRSPQ